MTTIASTDAQMAKLVKELQESGKPFAIATLIRTSGATSAKPGARAVLGEDGDIAAGWIGSQCVKGALRAATGRALSQGQPQFISLQPEEVLSEKGIEHGDDLDGVSYARNGCPSKGSLDIFVEPFLPLPQLLVIGESPVANALCDIAQGFEWSVEIQGEAGAIAPLAEGMRRMIVVATQGNGDFNGLKGAIEARPEFISFVGSRRKFAALSQRLEKAGISRKLIDRVQAPAGLAIRAVTPQEIALSIMAELTQQRRQNQRLDVASQTQD